MYKNKCINLNNLYKFIKHIIYNYNKINISIICITIFSGFYWFLSISYMISSAMPWKRMPQENLSLKKGSRIEKVWEPLV